MSTIEEGLKKNPWAKSANKLYRPSDSRLSAKLVPTFFFSLNFNLRIQRGIVRFLTLTFKLYVLTVEMKSNMAALNTEVNAGV
jgi:hypothetical protein